MRLIMRLNCIAVVTAFLASGCSGPEQELEVDFPAGATSAALETGCHSGEASGLVCSSEADWHAGAEESCASAGHVLTSVSVSGQCIGGGYLKASWKCCPADSEVCCEDSPGVYAVAAASNCDHVVDQTHCSDEPVCCETPNGYQSLPGAECPDAQVPADLCESTEKVCCAHADGTYAMTPADECDAPLPAADCQPQEDVCCQRPDGTIGFVPASDCTTPLPATECEPQEPVCCQNADGTASVVPASDCDAALVLSNDHCEPAEDVCCKNADGTVTFVPASDCDATQVVADDQCATETVCCEIAGAYYLTPANGCTTAVAMTLCEDPIVCCHSAGVISLAPASQCDAQLPMEDCQEPPVCCETASGYQIVASVDCPAGAQVSPNLCAVVPNDVCCLLDDGTYGYVAASDCASPQPDEKCHQVEECCQLDDGSFVLVLSGECPNGTVVPVEECHADELVCCETATGYQVVPASQCPAAQVPNDLCEPVKVCCETANGYLIVDASDCPAGAEAPMDLCEPTEHVCCKLADGTYGFVPADQCDSPSSDELCEPHDACCAMDDGTFQTVPASDCPDGQVATADQCHPVEFVCCETANGYQVVSASDCPNAQVPMDLCKPEDVCCLMDDGTYQTVSASDCPASQVAPAEKCKPIEHVCCETATGYQVVPASDCPNAQVPMDLCDATVEDVCCWMDDGTYQIVPSVDCPASQVAPAEKCKPIEHVCCETATGYQVVPASDCPTGAAVPLNLCDTTVEDVCCWMDDGTYQIVPSVECPSSQIAPAEKCEPIEHVCCETATGYQVVPASDCPTGAAVPIDLCDTADVCCKLDDGTFAIVPATQCSTAVSAEWCEPTPDVCCKLADGSFAAVPQDECDDPMPWDACEEEICCKTAAGYIFVAAIQCPGPAVNPALCQPDEDVCCKLDDGSFAVIPATQCDQPLSMDECKAEVCCKTSTGYQTVPAIDCPGGQVVDDDRCEPEEDVCCKLQDGSIAIVPQSQCQSPIPMKHCTAEVCCKTDLGYQTVPAVKCPAGAIVSSDFCDAPVCCQFANGGTGLVPASECNQPLPAQACESPCKRTKLKDGECRDFAGWQALGEEKCEGAGLYLTDITVGEPCADGGFSAAKIECCPEKPKQVCCQTVDGPQIVPINACDQGFQLAVEICQPCDELTLGGPTSCKDETTWVEYATKTCKRRGQVLTSWELGAECNGGAESITFTCCDEEPPCFSSYLSGKCLTEAEWLTQASMVCEAAGMVVVSHTVAGECKKGYQAIKFECCPADPTGCDQAVGGWCDGYDYTEQCLDFGGSCGPNAIFADQNCDGSLDVCLLCPAGTHPVDLDGDGCEESCDCCEPLTCVPGTKPVDNDGDGCDDTCVSKPCEDGLSGFCDDQNYSNYVDQCLSQGGVCGPNAIFGDQDCDGTLDVCLLCPVGTHPADLDGDGCEESCDCCAPIKCVDGTVPVDSDNDGCDDECQVPYCDDATFGWCDGLDEASYLDQCLAAGGGCGPTGILADNNCDGSLDVCQLCPAGTHPVDLNGDGCEEACDCCDPIKCPVGTEPLDTDKDGCADTCSAKPCDQAVSGWCDDQDAGSYLQQCLAAGGGCGPNGILADNDCDGELDVCLVCPAGTHAADLDGDGCEETCDCCEPIVCPAGSAPTDTDADGCPDSCKSIIADSDK